MLGATLLTFGLRARVKQGSYILFLPYDEKGVGFRGDNGKYGNNIDIRVRVYAFSALHEAIGRIFIQRIPAWKERTGHWAILGYGQDGKLVHCDKLLRTDTG
jgi:hypothetical protein